MPSAQSYTCRNSTLNPATSSTGQAANSSHASSPLASRPVPRVTSAATYTIRRHCFPGRTLVTSSLRKTDIRATEATRDRTSLLWTHGPMEKGHVAFSILEPCEIIHCSCNVGHESMMIGHANNGAREQRCPQGMARRTRPRRRPWRERTRGPRRGEGINTGNL